MKTYFKTHFYFILLLISSCSLPDKKAENNTQLTEQEIRKIFIDSVEARKNNWLGIFNFIQTYYPSVDLGSLNNQEVQTIYALEEDFLSARSFDPSRHLIRLIVNPTFSKPYSVKLELKNGKTYLTTKMLGQGGYMARSKTQVLPDSLFLTYARKFQDQNFWQLKDDTICSGFDGIDILFEAIDDSKYARVRRWSPLACDDRVTVNLGRIAQSLTNLGLDDEMRKLAKE